jgi:hypothetical protein
MGSQQAKAQAVVCWQPSNMERTSSIIEQYLSDFDLTL